MSENVVWPGPGEPLLSSDGKSMSDRYWNPLNQISKLLNSVNKAFGNQIGDSTLGTAAVEDIGTSGDAVPKLNAANVWDNQQSYGMDTLTDGAAISWDVNAAPVAKVTTAASRLITPTGMAAGGQYQLLVVSGGFSPTWAGVVKWPSGAAPTLAGTCVVSFLSDGTLLYGVAVKNFS